MKKSSLTFLFLGSLFISNNAYSDRTYIFSDAVTDFCIFDKNDVKKGCLKNLKGMFIDKNDFPVTIANCDDLKNCRTYKLPLDYASSWSWAIWGGSDLFWATHDIPVHSAKKK